ncbi:SGNH/GDSL hydrolase family protein [Thalassoglobus sp. JC818]|uniref:SGNH/GDSL hydrolase family protein n=1 Tax=Thalassoglobus sp. JC818 TaxID=3232136 RepID=UPI00345B017E
MVRSIVFRILMVCSLLNAAAMGAFAGDQDLALKAERVLFLGDSITHSGYYISLIELELLRQSSDAMPEVINLGLPSETASGLSEPGHPFPRPNVHERLERALEKLKPDVVVACYGMNDGIYHPFDEDRFEIYQTGINSLIEKVHNSGAKLILLTPPPFDPLPLKMKGKLVSADADEFAYYSIYDKYDDVIKRYSDWILAQKDRVEMVIDLHTPVTKFVAEKRKSDPEFVLSGDGVHLDQEGHRILAEAILNAWGVKLSAEDDQSLEKLVHQRQMLWHAAYLSDVGHVRPGMNAGLPLDEAAAKAGELTKQIDDQLAKTQASENSQ